MSLRSGVRLGPYEVQSLLGAGGMGEVYRARDTKLGRDVALKILPDLFASDPERLARFEREAKVLASLNHPNIAQIHGLEEGDRSAGPGQSGSRALVMELVEGPTLAERIAHGPIPIDEALPIAKQIAEALEAAHEQGIIHRDLKPANVKVRDDGTVKVLDFGLAKALGPDPASASAEELANSPTITSPATQIGVILGTAAYMSPEQAKGRPIDRRADVWAFGCVLYEMLTGRRAFAGDDVSDTLAFVLMKDPAWEVLPATLPPAIRKLLRRCLERDRRRRLDSIADARLEIEDALAQPAGVEAIEAAPRAPGWKRRAPWIVAALSLGFAGLALLVGRPWDTGEGGGTVRSEARRMTFDGSATLPALSPRGDFLAYATVACPPGQACRAQLMVQDLAGGDPVSLGPTVIIDGEEVGPLWFWSIDWSPDGQQVLYTASYGGLESLEGVYAVPRLGGTHSPLATDVTPTSAAFRPAGGVVDWIEFPEGLQAPPVLRSLRLDTQESETHALPIRATHHQWSPDGRWLALIGSATSETFGSRRIVILSQDLNVMDQLDVHSGSTVGGWPQVRWSLDGGVLYTMASADLLGVAVDPRSGQFSGSLTDVVTGLDAPGWPQERFDLSRDGRSAVFARTGQNVEIRTLTKDGDTYSPSTVASGMTWRDYPALSPDGERLAVVREDRLGANVYLQAFAGGPEQALTASAGHKTHLRWSSDGSHVAYVGYDREGAWLHTVSVVSRQTHRIGRVASSGFSPFAWFQDRAKLLFRGDNGILWTATLDGAAEELFPLPASHGFVWGFLVSPDGTSVGVFNHGYGTSAGLEVWVDVAPLRPGPPQWRTVFREDWRKTFDAGRWYESDRGISDWRWQSLQRWGADDRLILAFSTRENRMVSAGLWAVPAAGGPPEQLVDLGPTCGAPSIVSMTPDGRRVVCVHRRIESDVWQVDNFDPGRR